MLLASFLWPTLLLFHHLQLTLIHWMHAYSNADSAKGCVCVCVCVWRKEGGAFPLMHLLCSVTLKLTHLFRLSLRVSLSFSLFTVPVLICFVSLFFCPFCICVLLVSGIHAHLTQAYNLSHNRISHSPVLYHPSSLSLSVFLLNILDFLAAAPPSQLLYSAFTPWLCSLRQESAADWGGCFKSIIALGLRLHLSLSFSPLSSCLLSLRSVSESQDDRACLFLQGTKCHTIFKQEHLTLSTHYASEVAYLPLQISVTVSELSVQ